MTVIGRRAEDIDEFMEKLEATGAFEEVVPTQQDRTDEGCIGSPSRASTPGPRRSRRDRAAGAAEARRPRRDEEARRCAMTLYRRIFHEKRALIWPVIAGIVLNIALFALVVYPLVAEGRDR